MPASRERTPHERETLMFDRPEAARQFSERVAERIQKESQPDIKRDKEILSEEISEEFAQAGEAVNTIAYPWEHSPAEHAEVQELVNIAFSQDMKVALEQAKKSPNYPRNLDLFHDLLTTEMYEHLKSSGLNKQPASGWFLAMAIVALLTLAAILLVFLI